MKIEFQRSGGFAGMTMSSSVDTTELPEDQARQFKELVSNLDLSAIQSEAQATASRGPQRGADRFQYDLTVENEGEQYKLTIGEANLPPQLKPLLNKMQDLAGGR